MNDKNPFFLGRSELTCIILHFSVAVNVFARQYWLQTMSRRQPKSFLIQQFFKNAGEVWASSPHLRSKSDFQIKLQQKSRRKSKESQLPFQSRGCNENTRFQGQLRSQGKLGMCPSLAEPDSGGIPRRTSLRENGLQRPAKGGSTPAFACGS